MTSLTLALVMHATLAGPVDNYAVAYKQMKEEGKPLVVLVGAPWCPACQQMSQGTIPQAKKQGMFQNVAYAYVNSDNDPELANRLLSGRAIPQLIMFHNSPEGWKRQQLIGAQSTSSLQSFVNRGVEATAAAAAKTKLASQPVEETQPK